MTTFTPTHRWRAAGGDPSLLVQVLLLDPPFAYGRQCVALIEGREGEHRLGTSRLMNLDECSCEPEDVGTGETGPQLILHNDPNCPEHGYSISTRQGFACNPDESAGMAEIAGAVDEASGMVYSDADPGL